VLVRVGEHVFQQRPGLGLVRGLLGAQTVGGADAAGEVVAGALERAEVEQARAAPAGPARRRRDRRVRARRELRELALQAGDLGPQRPPRG
jgi:hypothetical protein